MGFIFLDNTEKSHLYIFFNGGVTEKEGKYY